jgi:hypothetical protein
LLKQLKTMGTIISVLIVTMLNLFITKELTKLLSETIFDKTTFYRICLIPPIGVITFAICFIVVIIVYLIETIIDIWR